MLDRLYLCTSCGKIILVNIYQHDKFDKILGFMASIKKYLGGNPIRAFRNDLSEACNYTIKDKIPVILSNFMIPDSFTAKSDSDILEIVALRYSTVSKINVFHLR